MSSIILIGYMGCGKSTIGKRLSTKMNKPFIDTDQYIEEKQNCPISEIFNKHGEQFFRELETQCLKELIEKKCGYIVAVGGGLPMKEENRVLLKQLGTVIYLAASPQTIYKRVQNDTKRPLLQVKNPKERIMQMLNVRVPIYEESADILISVNNKKIRRIIREIEEEIALCSY